MFKSTSLPKRGKEMDEERSNRPQHAEQLRISELRPDPNGELTKIKENE
jgi:hypothetical protein